MSDDTDGEIQYSQVENFIFFAQFFRYADRMHDAVVTLHRQSENDVRSPLRLTKMEVCFNDTIDIIDTIITIDIIDKAVYVWGNKNPEVHCFVFLCKEL